MNTSTINAVGTALQVITAEHPNLDLLHTEKGYPIASERLTMTWEQLHSNVEERLDVAFMFEDADQFRDFVREHETTIAANHLVIIQETPQLVTIYGLNPQMGEDTPDPIRPVKDWDSYNIGYETAMNAFYTQQYARGYQAAVDHMTEEFLAGFASVNVGDESTDATDPDLDELDY